MTQRRYTKKKKKIEIAILKKIRRKQKKDKFDNSNSKTPESTTDWKFRLWDWSEIHVPNLVWVLILVRHRARKR